MPAASPSPKRALILAAGFRLQYRVLRCAAEAFDEVFVLGLPDAGNLKLSARCSRFFPAAAGFAEAHPETIAQVNDLCRTYDVDLVLPSCAETTRFIAMCGSDLATESYPVPSLAAFDTLDDKWAFARVCSGLGVPVPKTRLFETRAELLSASRSGQISFPCVVKPLSMWGSFGVAKVERAEDVEPEGYEPILVQDYVPGTDLCAFYLCVEGSIVAALAYERTEEGVRFIATPEIDSSAAALVSHLNCSGVVGFDVRRSPDGSHFFIECNPRFWYRMEIAAIAGLNFVALGAGTKRSPSARIPAGTAIRSPKNLLATFLTPWRLSANDLALLRYLASDPFPILMAAFEKLRGRDRLAQGRQLLWPLLFLPTI